jgi:hypothetical protein
MNLKPNSAGTEDNTARVVGTAVGAQTEFGGAAPIMAEVLKIASTQ